MSNSHSESATRSNAESSAPVHSHVKSKLVVITGGGRGIGKRLALGFAGAGAHVALIARSKAELDLTKLEIEHAGGSAVRLEGDVRDREFVTEAINRATAHFARPVSVLICAAGIQGPIGPITEADPQKWWDVLDVNLRGTFHAVRAALPAMMESRFGKIVAISGGGAAKPRPFFTAYAASKAALVRMMESLAEEVRDYNIQANCMSPGGTYTAMTDEILRAGDRAGWKDLEVARQVQMTGGVKPQRQLRLAMFLTSPKSNHISGRMIHVEDDWERLADTTLGAEAYTLRRLHKG